MTQDTKTIEEIVEEFWQYMADGYNGGKEGLRCFTCDHKYRGTSSYGQLCPRCMAHKVLAERYEEGVTIGRVSVLQDFDNMCMADAFMGFTDEEWSAIRKFFAFNKKISNWDK